MNLAATGDCTLDGPTAPATLHLTGAGSCTVTASQPGNANYNAAPDVVQTFAIAQAAQTITFEQPASPATYGSTFGVAPTASSGLPVSVVASGGCAISGSTVTMTSGTVDCVLTASQAGNDDYLPAENVVRTVAAAKAVLSVRPAPQNPARQYSDANPAFTPVIEGYVLGDGPSALTHRSDLLDDGHGELAGRPVPDHVRRRRGRELHLLLHRRHADREGGGRERHLRRRHRRHGAQEEDQRRRAAARDRPRQRGGARLRRHRRGRHPHGDGHLQGGQHGALRPAGGEAHRRRATTGAVNCAKTLNVGKHVIDVIVGGNYVDTARETIEVSANPPSKSVRGLGAFVVTSPAGSYAADSGSVALFDFDAEADSDAQRPFRPDLPGRREDVQGADDRHQRGRLVRAQRRRQPVHAQARRSPACARVSCAARPS